MVCRHAGILFLQLTTPRNVFSFTLGAASHDDENPVVGCVLQGALINVHDILVFYSGRHCYSAPPPPPQLYDICPKGFKFAIASPWGVGQGWSLRVLMHADQWLPGRKVRVAFRQSDDQEADAGVEEDGVSGLTVADNYNASLVGSSKLGLDFTLAAAPESSCGQEADLDKTMRWGYRSMPSPMRSSRMHRPSHQMQFLAGGQASCAHLIGLNIRRRLDHRHHHCRHLLLSLLLSLHLRRLRRLHRHDRAGQGIIFTCRTCHQMDHRHKRPHTSPPHLLHHRPQDPPSIRSWQFINKHHGSGRQNRLTSVKQQRSRVNFGFRPWYSP